MAHKCKELDTMLNKILKHGFKCEYSGVAIKIYPPDKTKQMYIGHMGEKAFHPVRRYLKNICGIAV